MARFKSGTRQIPAAAEDFAVTGLALSFTPESVLVNVRQPAADAPIIMAYVTGDPTTSGFTVAFSAPVPSAGYLLDFTVFSADASPVVAGDTLAASYADLKNAVARFLGYDPSALTTSQTTEVDGYIQSGIRNFYYPPKMEGVDEHFEWSFIRQTGSIATSAGVGSYFLPDGFGRVAGQISVAGDFGPTIPVIPYGEIVKMRERAVQPDRPRFAAFTAEQAFGTRGQAKKIHLFPTPDKEYTLNFVCDADTGRIDPVNRPFPLGGAMFAELVVESCLAVAEQRADDEAGLHTQKFHELLVSFIARDRKSSAQDFGDIGDPEAREGVMFAPLRTRGCLY